MRRLAGSPDHGIRSVQLVIEFSVLLVVVVVNLVLEFLVQFLVVEFLVIVWIIELERLLQFGELKLVDAEPKHMRP